MKCLHYIVLWKCRTTSVSRLVSRVCNIPDFGSLLSDICKRRDTYSIQGVGCKAFLSSPSEQIPRIHVLWQSLGGQTRNLAYSQLRNCRQGLVLGPEAFCSQ